MSFYTNVQLVGDNLLYLGYEDGQRIQRKFKFSPTLLLSLIKKLNGRHLMVGMLNQLILSLSEKHVNL